MKPEGGTSCDDRLPILRESIRAIYDDLGREIEALGPRCALSGRCCRFEEYSHTLFLCEAEARVLLDEAPPPARPLDGGATCPWQGPAGHCTAREARPLGCRVYFCDPTYEPNAGPVTERYLERLRRLTGQLGLEWNYAPLHRHLERAAADGRFPQTLDTTPSDQYS